VVEGGRGILNKRRVLMAAVALCLLALLISGLSGGSAHRDDHASQSLHPSSSSAVRHGVVTLHTSGSDHRLAVVHRVFGRGQRDTISSTGPLDSLAPWLNALTPTPTAIPTVGATTPDAPAVAPAAVAPVAAASPAIPLPPRGQATASGCVAALAYLTAYAAPGFIIACPGYSQGHQATTMCITGRQRCDLGRFVTIADACPAAYMNEASNSYVVLGLSNAPIDPYGDCH
jgi:hypothetical protein